MPDWAISVFQHLDDAGWGQDAYLLMGFQEPLGIAGFCPDEKGRTLSEAELIMPEHGSPIGQGRCFGEDAGWLQPFVM